MLTCYVDCITAKLLSAHVLVTAQERSALGLFIYFTFDYGSLLKMHKLYIRYIYVYALQTE